MKGLASLERGFLELITNPERLQLGGEPRESPLPRADEVFRGGPTLDARERLAIYSRAYFSRLEECLCDDYPALVHALGADTFSELARDYVSLRPSRSPSLNGFGQGFAAFCAGRPESWAAFAADLARLEWALVEVVHEPSSLARRPETLASSSAEEFEQLELRPVPALRFLRLEHPVNDYFQCFREGKSSALPAPRPTATVVQRRGMALWRIDVDPRAAEFLADLLDGVALGKAVARLDESSTDDAERGQLLAALPGWLQSWFANEFFLAPM